MEDFTLQTKINYSTRLEVNSYSKKQELEREIETLNAKIKQGIKKDFAFLGAFIFIYTLINFTFGFAIDYTITIVLLMWSFIEFIILLNSREQTKKILKVWNENSPELNES